ncbi:hypothetical protein [Aureispira anguillae]|uniref:Uncharacterized protein n=1 Tax=Aureispira anguillae TaxID=2864201 RepID=A0A915YGT2_9BACT|nr:hypothetical protein [Aureispira anguillae]BDS12765.1 hypothetical protein AsAng_0034900 [Aureispira anguillae]
MEGKKTRALLKKWHEEYPTACQLLVSSLEQIDQQLGNEWIPVELMIEFHQALAQDMMIEIQEKTAETGTAMIRFDQLNPLMKFHWCGKRYLKLNNHFNGAYSNCKCLDTKVEHKFKPDDLCLIPAQFLIHQGA